MFFLGGGTQRNVYGKLTDARWVLCSDDSVDMRLSSAMMLILDTNRCLSAGTLQPHNTHAEASVMHRKEGFL